jgi:hypothetical protein
MDPMGPLEPDPTKATEDDLRTARLTAVKLYELLCSPAVAAAIGVASPSQALVGCAILGAVLIGKLKAEGAAEPETFAASVLPMLQQELRFLEEESLRGRTRSIAGLGSWAPIDDLRQRASKMLGVTGPSVKGGDA